MKLNLKKKYFFGLFFLICTLQVLATDWHEFEWGAHNLKFNVPSSFKVNANNKKEFLASQNNKIQFQLTPEVKQQEDSKGQNTKELVIKKRELAKDSSNKNSGNSSMEESKSKKEEIVFKKKELDLAKGLSGFMVALRVIEDNKKMIHVTLTINNKKENQTYTAFWSWPDEEKSNEENFEISYEMAKSFQIIE